MTKNADIPWVAMKQIGTQTPEHLKGVRNTIQAMEACVRAAEKATNPAEERTYLRRIGACAHGLVAEIQEELKR